ncbi:hypothetical protein D9757_000778 [Collybiopsis confluens]|uniref:C2H2-type domain-containing protein n=1 Tax=Collybiopsis confluens TaxID=2823264 RepID=A0A8H5MGX9_9AGAR|nr:hypothetical protein D9757_000778 [Collybiopsis confluens]
MLSPGTFRMYPSLKYQHLRSLVGAFLPISSVYCLEMNPNKGHYPTSNHWDGQQYRPGSGTYSSSYDPTSQAYSAGDEGYAAAGYYAVGNESYLPGGNPSSSMTPSQYRYSQSMSTTSTSHPSRQSQHYSSHSEQQSHSPASPTGHTHGHSYNHSVSHPYGQSYMQSSSYPTQSRPRSHSHSRMSPYDATPSASHYPPQVPLSPSTSMTQYTASPSRPFACDLCSLSFNRQHDLKRHRETHTGEKPYLCNGGCGKTFTRKDALKRHQLVKGCGKVDETNS